MWHNGRRARIWTAVPRSRSMQGSKVLSSVSECRISMKAKQKLRIDSAPEHPFLRFSKPDMAVIEHVHLHHVS